MLICDLIPTVMNFLQGEIAIAPIFPFKVIIVGYLSCYPLKITNYLSTARIIHLLSPIEAI